MISHRLFFSKPSLEDFILNGTPRAAPVRRKTNNPCGWILPVWTLSTGRNCLYGKGAHPPCTHVSCPFHPATCWLYQWYPRCRHSPANQNTQNSTTSAPRTGNFLTEEDPYHASRRARLAIITWYQPCSVGTRLCFCFRQIPFDNGINFPGNSQKGCDEKYQTSKKEVEKFSNLFPCSVLKVLPVPAVYKHLVSRLPSNAGARYA